MSAWLQRTDGSREEVGLNCYVGRSIGSTVHIDSIQVSRRHAQIHAQQSETGMEYWIADLGSTNGTIRNGRRVAAPCRLNHGDQIQIGEARFTFLLDDEAPRLPTLENEGSATILLQGRRACWLLMVDIKGYTSLSQTLTEDELGQTIGGWFRRTRDAIEGAGGVVDKFLGDAIFAYWEDGQDVVLRVAKALRDLASVQVERNPEFRIVLHRGLVLLQGGAGGANNLSGLEVIFVFRMEKICAGLNCDAIVSAPARKVLAEHYETVALGAHRLDGFSGQHELFALSPNKDLTQRT